MKVLVQFLLLLVPCSAWVVTPTTTTSRHVSFLSASVDKDLEEPKRNPDKPELPELKGDFDWDAKFSGDDDWIVEDVPGKIVVNEVDLAKQVTALGKLEDEWRKAREIDQWDKEKKVGWVDGAELLNGRTAMFFLVTGLLTEYWTGYSMPQQVEEMLRIGGFIGFD